MRPILFKICGIPIYSYGFFLAMAFLICVTLLTKKTSAKAIPSQKILDLMLYIIIFAIAGARLFYVIANMKYYAMHPVEIIMFNKGGLVFYGGFIFALILGLIIARIYKLPVLEVSDLLALYLPLGHAIGRIGCFMNGCCYGTITNSFLGVRFPENSFAQNQFGPEHLVHPAQIYSSVADLLIFIILSVKIKHKTFNGEIILDYMFLYGSARFFLEYFRADNPAVLFGFNTPQLISLLLIAVALTLGAIRICRNPQSAPLP